MERAVVSSDYFVKILECSSLKSSDAEAITFAFNPTSSRVLEKSGFAWEGTLKNCYKKDGKVFEGNIYSLVPEDLNKQIIF